MIKKIKGLIDIHINGQLYALNKKIKNNYDIIYSEIIDDEYWNFAYIKNNEINIRDEIKNIINDMKELKRIPLIYITSNILNQNIENQIEECNLKNLYTDVWMTIENIEEFATYKSNIDFTVNEVNKKLQERFIQSVMEGFSGDNPEDPYGELSDGYRVALRRTFEYDSDYKIIHYLGIHEDEAISTATAVCKEDKAIIYNVTTKKKYQKQGVCKQTMSEIISDLKNIGIKTVCVQTEEGFYTEKAYKNMGFKEIMKGKAYTIES